MPLKNDTLHSTEFDMNHARASVPGMAYFAHTGPRRTTCGDCEYLQPHIGKPTQNRCQKYFWMMRQWGKVHLPASTPSCKYFSEK